jgi:hypothetical protein
MKYWIFQSNQVLGPYEPDDLSRHSSFGAESLVCPEGRKGTTMGDWQRAGMVPDLSVALVRAAQSNGAPTSVATMMGLPPEPTLKDLAMLGSLQEKMSMMEDIVLQLQEGLRVKDSELAALHQELAGKERQSTAMKTALEREAEDLKRETDDRKREADALKAEADAFKNKIKELEDRVGAMNRLSETIDKAVEAEKHVEQDVEAQGATLAELTKEIEKLRTQLHDRLTGGLPPLPAEPVPGGAAPISSASTPPAFDPPNAWAPPSEPSPASSLPSPSLSVPAPSAPPPAAAAPAPVPAFGGAEASPFAAPGGSVAMPLDPVSGSFSAAPTPVADAAPVVDDAVAAPPAPSGRKKGLIYGALFGLVALGVLAVYSGRLGGKKSSAPSQVSMPMPAPVAAPVLPPPPPPPPEPDPREAAIEAAKEWELPDGRTLGGALETLSPPSGNLSPWMAEPLADKRLSVNYFAHGTPGAPTVAYEFEVDLAAKTVAGRNAAAKAVIAGKATPPPAPPKAKPVKVKAKSKNPSKVSANAPGGATAFPAAKPAEAKAESLDSLLGDAPPVPQAKPMRAAPAKKAAPAADAPAPANEDPTVSDDADAPPAKPTAAKRAAKASAKTAPADASAPSGGKAADEALLDDMLKE